MITITEALQLLPEGKKKAARLWSGYSLTWLPLAAGAASAKATVTTQDSSDFIALRLIAYSTDNAAPPVELTSPQATLTITVGSNAMFPDNTPVHIGPMSASAAERRGLELEYPIWVARQTTLTALLTNLTAAIMNVRIVLTGIRILDYDK